MENLSSSIWNKLFYSIPEKVIIDLITLAVLSLIQKKYKLKIGFLLLITLFIIFLIPFFLNNSLTIVLLIISFIALVFYSIREKKVPTVTIRSILIPTKGVVFIAITLLALYFGFQIFDTKFSNKKDFDRYETIGDNLLRSKGTLISDENLTKLIKKNDFYDKVRNKKGQNKIIYEKSADLTTIRTSAGLMWEIKGSPEKFKWNNVQDHIKRLNSSKYGGYNDWRIPTIEELASIMENSDSEMHISDDFSKTQIFCWSCDTDESFPNNAWLANFLIGQCLSASIDAECYVRAVRSL